VEWDEHNFDKPLFWPILALSWPPISLYFYTKSTWERDRFASFDSNMLILWLIRAFRENLRVLRRKIALTRNWRKNRGQTEPRESKRKRTEGRTTMHGEARPCYRPRKVARPCLWLCLGAQLLVLGGTAVCLGTGGRAPLHGRTSLHDRTPDRFLWYNFEFRLLFGGFLWLGFLKCLN